MVKDKTLAENFLKREGRLNRLRYFKRNVVLVIVTFILMFIAAIIFMDYTTYKVSTAGHIAFFIIMLIMFVPSYCLVVRRLHDMDRDELLAKMYIAGGVTSFFLNFILKYEFEPLEIVMVILGLYILLVPGTQGANRYGSDPLK